MEKEGLKQKIETLRGRCDQLEAFARELGDELIGIRTALDALGAKPKGIGDANTALPRRPRDKKS